MIIYAISTNDSANIKLPEGFPGTIGSVRDKRGKIILNPESRSTNDEFDYFISQILSAISPTFNKFGHKNCTELISEIYGNTDEAVGLLVIYN